MDKDFKIGICKGRHPLPCDFYIYEKEISDPTNVLELERIAREKIEEIITDYNMYACKIEIYVTGLIVAVAAVEKVAREVCPNVSLMHYDKNNNCYFEQEVQSIFSELKTVVVRTIRDLWERGVIDEKDLTPRQLYDLANKSINAYLYFENVISLEKITEYTLLACEEFGYEKLIYSKSKTELIEYLADKYMDC